MIFLLLRCKYVLIQLYFVHILIVNCIIYYYNFIYFHSEAKLYSWWMINHFISNNCSYYYIKEMSSCKWTGMCAYAQALSVRLMTNDSVTQWQKIQYSTRAWKNTHPASSLLEMNGNRNLPRTDGPYNECMTNIAI